MFVSIVMKYTVKGKVRSQNQHIHARHVLYKVLHVFLQKTKQNKNKPTTTHKQAWLQLCSFLV